MSYRNVLCHMFFLLLMAGTGCSNHSRFTPADSTHPIETVTTLIATDILESATAPPTTAPTSTIAITPAAALKDMSGPGGQLFVVTAAGSLARLTPQNGVIETLSTGRGKILNARFSPSQGKLFYWLKDGGESRLFWSFVDEWKPELLLSQQLSEYNGAGMWWIDHRYLLIELFQDENHEIQPREFFVVDSTSSTIVFASEGTAIGCVLAQTANESRVVTWCPIRETRDMSIEPSQYLVIDSVHGVNTDMGPPPIQLSDPFYGALSAWLWSMDGTELLVPPGNPVGSDSQIGLMDAATGTLSIIETEGDTIQLNAWFSESGVALISANRFGTDSCPRFSCLYLIDPSNGEIIFSTTGLASGPWRSLVISPSGGHVAVLGESLEIFGVNDSQPTQVFEASFLLLLGWVE